MKKVIFLSLIGFPILFSNNSCELSQYDTKIEITVKDGNSWNLMNKEMDLVQGANVNIYRSLSDARDNNPPDYTAETDTFGKVSLKVEFQEEYYFTVQKGNSKNVIDGFVIFKIFESEKEIIESPDQTPVPTVGSPMFIDFNMSGKVDNEDKIYADFINVSENDVASKKSIIYEMTVTASPTSIIKDDTVLYTNQSTY